MPQWMPVSSQLRLWSHSGGGHGGLQVGRQGLALAPISAGPAGCPPLLRRLSMRTRPCRAWATRGLWTPEGRLSEPVVS